MLPGSVISSSSSAFASVSPASSFMTGKNPSIQYITITIIEGAIVIMEECSIVQALKYRSVTDIVQTICEIDILFVR